MKTILLLGAGTAGTAIAHKLRRRLTKDDLVPQVKDVLTAMDFMDMSEGAQIIFI